jgi:hypothetical protein
MSAPIETLLSRLDGVQQVKASGWKSRCPAHNGEGKSLAITLGNSGHILIYCFAHECEPGDILAAVGMSVGDLFPERLPERRANQPPLKHAMPAIDVMRVMKFELTRVQLIVSDIANGTADVRVIGEAMECADRLRKALDLCSA